MRVLLLKAAYHPVIFLHDSIKSLLFLFIVRYKLCCRDYDHFIERVYGPLSLYIKSPDGIYLVVKEFYSYG